MKYIPQNPNFEQQTLSGQFVDFDHCKPHPGSHSDFWSQLDWQLSGEQNVGPRPQTPPLEQQPRAQGRVAELMDSKM